MRFQSILLFLNLFIFFTPQSVLAQDQDSIAFVQADRTTKRIKNGVIWHRVHSSELFGSTQEINWIEIDLKKHQKRLHLAADSAELKTTSDFAKEQQALVAINGGFFDMKNGGSIDYIRVDGEVINVTKAPSNRANAVLSFDNRHVDIQANTLAHAEDSSLPNVLVSGPLLIERDTLVTLERNPFNDNRHPRTAIGLSPNNTLILLVVDGRNRMAQGMSLPELSKIMKWLDVHNAMNLDGGGSTTMYIKGATDTDIVNHPSDNKSFDHQGERSVANIIYLK
ncbi:MAG TPA: phosphodiester glycosidase family protein [Candidatus Sphingobacterium stercorigallinarum]|nr:phosphodiester glycosidase family protein [Candidatus Sphingobacterium stercorigallinarum]